jgi:hypothetical protein
MLNYVPSSFTRSPTRVEQNREKKVKAKIEREKAKVNGTNNPKSA